MCVRVSQMTFTDILSKVAARIDSVLSHPAFMPKLSLCHHLSSVHNLQEMLLPQFLADSILFGLFERACACA